MIITEIKITPKKAVIKFRTKTNDPFEQSVTYDSPLPPEQRSHIEAVGEYIIAEARKQMDAEDSQQKMTFDSPEIEPAEGEDVEEDSDDWDSIPIETIPIPKYEGTDIPMFKNMEAGHIEYLIRTTTDKDELNSWLEYNFDGLKKNLIPETLSLEASRDRAIEIIFRMLKIKTN